MILSVILPSRNEFPQIVFTIYSILHCWEADGFKEKDIEIIIVDNCSDDNQFPQRGTKGTTSYLEGRSMYSSGKIRILRDPIAGNHSARNKGAEIAKGKYLFFSDAHMAYKPGFFKTILQTVDESKGMVHGAIAWMGAYPSYTNEGNPHGTGFQYSIKLGEEIKGTWANYAVDTEKWFYIPALGHCSVAVRRDQFMKFGGYPKVHRTYGGGEFYINMKWWMFGSSVAVHPKAIGYHLSSGRGYSYNHDDYIENVLGMSYALGMDEWRERAYINWMRKGRKEVLDKIMARNEVEYADDRKFVAKRRKMTFNELIVALPWDKANDRRLGKHYSALSIFHDTWLVHLREAPDYVQEVYDTSPLQKGLEEFINTKLSKYVYKRKN
ncbi:MAG TPA: glycosyltransferase family 2 protein [bacterium]|nr:glycosyltransferase family 2 protein [bacterium]